MYTISKEFHFSASHVLHKLPGNHPCSRLHGHNYIVIAEFASEMLNETGFVIDYRDLEPIKKWLDDNFDHKNLNDQIPFNPTAENLARFLYHEFVRFSFHDLPHKPTLSAIIVKETEKTTARYEP